MADDYQQRLGTRIDTTADETPPIKGDMPSVDASEFTQPFVPPNTPAQPQAPARREVPGERLAENVDRITSRQESPTIRKLRQAFGIASIPLLHFNYGGFKWSFRVPGKADITWAVVLTGLNNPQVISAEFDDSEDEFKAMALRSTMINMTLKTALMCVSLAAIDDVPVHEHFGLDVDARRIIDKMRPPKDIRHDAAKFTYDILADESAAHLTDALEEFYSKHIDPKLQEEERIANPLEEGETSESTSKSATST